MTLKDGFVNLFLFLELTEVKFVQRIQKEEVVAEMWVEQLLILQLLEKYKCGDKQM